MRQGRRSRVSSAQDACVPGGVTGDFDLDSVRAEMRARVRDARLGRRCQDPRHPSWYEILVALGEGRGGMVVDDAGCVTVCGFFVRRWGRWVTEGG